MDIYCEQNVLNEKIDRKRKRATVLNVVRFVLLGVGVVLSYLMLMGVLFTPVENETINWGAVAFQVVFAVLILAPFVVTFIFLGKYINNTNLEYDYVLTDGNFRIVKVINRKKRKKMLEVPLSTVESIGKLDGEAYDRYASNKEIKKTFAVCDYENEDAVVYLYYGQEGKHYLLHIQPNEEMMVALRRSVTRISVIDKSIKLSPTGASKS